MPVRPTSVADGLNAPFAGEWTIALGKRYLDDIVLLRDPEILSGTLDTLHRVGVHLDAFSTSETRLSCFMDRKDLRLAAAALLTRFRLKR